MLFKRLKYSRKSIVPLTEVQRKARKEVMVKVDSGYYKFETLDCIICNSENSKSVSNRDRYGLKYEVQICKNCGLVYTSPRMTQLAYNEFYDLEYRRLYLGAEKPFADYFNKQYKRGENIFSYLMKLDLLSGNDIKILEVGCSSGGILAFFNNKGFKTIGVDLDSNYLNYGRKEYGLNLIHGTIQDIPKDFHPDIIIYSHVLEHVLDLEKELKTIREMVTSSTKIYIEVPGIKNVHIAYNSDILYYFQNAHTYHFTLSSLKNLMNKYDFKFLTGDEFIRSVFLPASKQEGTIKSDYIEVIGYLKKTERHRMLKLFKINILISYLKNNLVQFKR